MVPLPRVATAAPLLLLGGLALALGTMDRWLFVMLDPGPFDPAATPAAPDYTTDAAWAALPTREDAADVALPAVPAIDPAAAPVATFYVHPTTWLGPAWNGPWDDPAVIDATARGGTLIQGSVFNGSTAVYAPRYRQSNGLAFIAPDDRGAAARRVSYGDLSAAFDVFLSRIGDAPFIVAAHSQGTELSTRLLRERIANTPLMDRLVVAVLLGGTIAEGDTGVPTCTNARQTGCLIAYNARGPGYQPGELEFDAANPATMRDRVCVNPLSWDDPTRHVPADQHGGAVFFDTETPQIRPAFADAQCQRGSLVLRQHGDLERDLPSRVLLWLMGPENYHPVEYQLFYIDLRRTIAERVASHLEHQQDRGKKVPQQAPETHADGHTEPQIR